MFSGGILVQIVRPLIYIAGFIILIFLSVAISESWSEQKKNRRRRLIAELLPSLGDSPQGKSIVNFICNIFEHDGLKGLKRAQTLLLDDKKLKEHVELHLLQKEIAQGEAIFFQPSFYRLAAWGLSELIDTGIISIDEDGVETDMDLLNLLDIAIRHLEENGPKNI